MTSVRVIGVDFRNEESLEIYFSSKRKSGGGDIKDVHWEGRDAIITFEETDAAKGVLLQGNHMIGGQPVTVEVYDPYEKVMEEAAVVKVTGLSPDMEDEEVETYFESRRKSGGGDVVKVERQKGGLEAIVTFEEKTAAEGVLNKTDHKLDGKPITVTPFDPNEQDEAEKEEEEMKEEEEVDEEEEEEEEGEEEGTTEQIPVVKVTGLPPNMQDEDVEAYFESKRKSGGGEVVKVERRRRGREAIVTFEEMEAAQGVILRTGHAIKGQRITVELYDPEDDVTEQIPVVKVTGLPPDTEDEQLETYFESKRKSGGGEVVKVERRKRGREAIVTFEEMEVAQRVASRPNHAIKGQTITVELYDPDDDVTEQVPIVKVTGLPPDMENEQLESYFESKRKSGGGDVVKVERRKRGREAIVTFEEMEVTQRVASRPHHAIKGQTITVELYDPDDDIIEQDPVIKVTGLPPDTEDEQLETYFESKRKSGGGEVVKVERRRRGREAIVTFEEMEVAQRVASRPHHAIKGQTITVELYDPEDDDTEQVPIVKVTGLFPNMEDEQLESYFESKRKSGGGEVVKVERRKRGREAIVTFEEMEVAQRVASKSAHAIRNQPITVELYDPEDDVTEQVPVIKVTGLSPKIADEQVQMYFESKRKSGGGDVVKVERRKQGREAIVTFGEMEDMERVLGRSKHVLSKVTLNVTAHTDDDEDDDDDDDETANAGAAADDGEDESHYHSADEEPASCTVKVTAAGPGLSEEVLRLYMENERKSGGGDITSVETVPKENAFLVTFQSPEIARRVAERDSHKCAGQRLEARLYTPPPSYKDRVLVMGVPESVQPDTLTLYLENMSGLDLSSVLYGDQPGDVLVSFSGDVDHEKMRVAVGKRSLEGSRLTLASVEVSRCVAVRPVTDRSEVTALELHFDNEKRSGGRDLESCQYFPEYQQVVVKFEDHQVAKRVSEQRQRIGGKELEVSLFHECLGPSGGSSERTSSRLPDPVQITDADSRKISYLQEQPKARSSLAKALAAFSAEVQVQKHGRVELVCTLPEGTKLTRDKAKDWADKARGALDAFLQTLAADDIEVSQQLIQAVRDQAKGSMKDWPRFSLLESSSGKLSIVGPNDDIADVKKVLESVIADVKRKQNLKTEEMSIKLTDKMKLLKINGLPKELKRKYPQLQADFDLKAQKIRLTGTAEEVTEGKLSFLQLQEDLVETPVAGLTPVQVQFFKEPKAAEHVTAQLSRLGQPVTWSVQGNQVFLMTLPGVDPGPAQRALVSCACQKQFRLLDADIQALQTPQWRSKLKELRSGHDGTWVVSHDPKTNILDLVALETTVQGIEREIKDFFASARVPSQPPFPQNRGSRSSPPESGWDRGQSRDGPGSNSKSRSPTGGARAKSSPQSGGAPSPLGRSRVPNVRRPRVMLIQKSLETEEPDVIVNPVNKDLDLSRGRVSQALLAYGGPELQKECKTRYPKGIKEGEIAETKNYGKIICKAIYHIAMEHFDDRSGEKFMRGLVIRVLEKASAAGMTSVAFPALGTGNLKYPADVSAHCMYDAVHHFGAANPNTSISEVLFVIHPTDIKTYQAFLTEKKQRDAMPPAH